MSRLGQRVAAPAVIVAGALMAIPGAAIAHGPVAPVASSYLARVGTVPAGLDAKVVDGDQRIWLRASPRETVIVLDYRGAPYLRFSRAGVAVNDNSAMYYLNQTPVAQTPPANLTRATPPSWQRVTGSHDYGWHDGRLHALATVALVPGVSYVGRWSIPLLVDGRPSSVSGGVWHAGDPSIVWFWPILVLLACVLAAVRVRRPALDFAVARAVSVVALSATAAAGIGLELHGRPNVSAFQLVQLAAIVAFVGWGFAAVLARRPGWFAFFLISWAALWAGFEILPALLNGFVLIALPAFVARVTAVLCLGCGASLLLLVARLSARPRRAGARTDARAAA
jgi:hypothetical protein